MKRKTFAEKLAELEHLRQEAKQLSDSVIHTLTREQLKRFVETRKKTLEKRNDPTI